MFPSWIEIGEGAYGARRARAQPSSKDQVPCAGTGKPAAKI